MGGLLTVKALVVGGEIVSVGEDVRFVALLEGDWVWRAVLRLVQPSGRVCGRVTSRVDVDGEGLQLA